MVDSAELLAALGSTSSPASVTAGAAPGPADARHQRHHRHGRRRVWSGLLSEEHAAALLAEERDLWGFCDTDVNLVLSPLYHSAPLRFAMGTMLAGGRIVVPGPFDPAAITAAIEAERPTTMFCVPTHLQRLFAHWDGSACPTSRRFRLVAHAGAPCPAGVKRRLIELFPDGLDVGVLRLDRGPGHRLPQRGVARAARAPSAGPGRAGRVTLDDDGTIWCSVPEHARFSYYGDPGKTAAAWRDLRTGRARSRSATSAGSTRTATSTSTAAART